MLISRPQHSEIIGDLFLLKKSTIQCRSNELSRSNDTRWNNVFTKLLTLVQLRLIFDDFIGSEQRCARRLNEQSDARWLEDEDAV